MLGNGHRDVVRGSPLTVSLGASVRSRRSRLGISQEELAERAGLHRTYIAGIEGGGRNITLKSVEKLARALDTSVGILLTESESSSRRWAPSLLLVEDDPKDVESTLQAFRRARLTNEVHVERDGEGALDYLLGRGAFGGRRKPPAPQLVLLDLNLPRISGLDVLRRLRENPQTRSIPVIVFANSRKEDSSHEALRLGAVNSLTKPLTFPEFCRITAQLNFNWTVLQSPSAPQLPKSHHDGKRQA